MCREEICKPVAVQKTDGIESLAKQSKRNLKIAKEKGEVVAEGPRLTGVMMTPSCTHYESIILHAVRFQCDEYVQSATSSVASTSSLAFQHLGKKPFHRKSDGLRKCDLRIVCQG